MSEKTVVSARLDSSLTRSLDEYCARHGMKNRADAVREAIELLLEGATPENAERRYMAQLLESATRSLLALEAFHAEAQPKLWRAAFRSLTDEHEKADSFVSEIFAGYFEQKKQS